jgi:hypothetical protein
MPEAAQDIAQLPAFRIYAIDTVPSPPPRCSLPWLAAAAKGGRCREEVGRRPPAIAGHSEPETR